jgi:hypothetical protein
LNIYALYRVFQPGFRQRRMSLFVGLFRPEAATKILDVGGHVYDWEGIVPIDSSITLLNLVYPCMETAVPRRFTCHLGDGRKMPYADQSFDVAYSNSVIEHLRTFEDQKQFASEIRRVGRQVFVQTPNRWFFIEPHFIAPFVHFLPRRLARSLIRVCSLRGLIRRGDNVEIKTLFDELRLLTHRELRELFPDCEIHRERWLGMTKSFIAIRRHRPQDTPASGNPPFLPLQDARPAVNRTLATAPANGGSLPQDCR